jgi:hypothetical protein
MLRYVDIYFTCLDYINIGSHASSRVKSRPAIDFCSPSFRFVVTKVVVHKSKSCLCKAIDFLSHVMCKSMVDLNTGGV